MVLPIFAILVAKNDYIESGWYRVAAETEDAAVNKFTYEMKIPTWVTSKEFKECYIIDVHKSINAVII